MEVQEKNNKIIVGQPKNNGIVVMPLELDFGISHQMIEIQKKSNFKALLGYDLEDEKMILLKEALKRANKILVYRLNTGANAIYTKGHLKITAQSTGTRGNDLSIRFIPITKENKGQVSKIAGEKNEGQVSKIGVETMMRGEVVDFRVIGKEDEIWENEYIKFEGDVEQALLEERESVLVLSGGESYEVKEQEWEKFFERVGEYQWRALAITVETIKVKQKAVELIRRLREEEGRSVYGVMANYEMANYIGVISVANGVKLEGGRVLKRNECVAWMAGKVACFRLKEEEIDRVYEGAVDSDKILTRAQISKLSRQGQIVFYKVRNQVIISKDVNTFKMFTPKWGEAYRENEFVRLVDMMREDFHRLMKVYYVREMKQGRSRKESKIYFKEICIKYLCALRSRGVVYEINMDKDFEVFFAEDGAGVDISLVLKANSLEDRTYVEILYNKLIG